jgi:Ca-activated chloride channel family protein
MDRLKKMFDRQAATAPKPEAKDAALRAAIAAFDEDHEQKHERARQGSRLMDRLTGAADAARATLIGRRPMKMSHVLAGSVSVLVLSLAVLNVSQFQTPGGQETGAAKPDDARLGSGQSSRKVEAKLEEPAKSSGPAVPARPAETQAQTPSAEPAGRQNSASNAAPNVVLRDDKNTPSSIVVDGLAGALTGPVAPSDNAAIASNEKSRRQAGQSGAYRERDLARGLGITGGKPGQDKSEAGNVRTKQRLTAKVAEAESFEQSQFGNRVAGVVALAPVGGDEIGRPEYRDQGRDKFETVAPNPVKVTTEEPVSTFSIDVDTASYSFMRAAINNGVLPQKDAVRVEELINYFPYDYEGPETREAPFKASVSVFDTPWNADTKLMHVGIKGYQIDTAEAPRANLVFLIDRSGSMNAANKLPLLINSMKLLLDSLKPDDTVSIVTYAGGAGTVLAPTKVAEKGKIVAALEGLHAGGSTAGAEGVRQAYRLAEQNFDKDGVNRVILATDGDFNVGITNPDELKSFIERKRKTGVFLSVLGFGMGNYNDQLMQTLAQNGDGAAAYIDTLSEARKVLVEEAGSTLFPIAKDVKIQMEFNPQTVSEYRLIGYETRLLNREDFNNDKIDAGEIGAGHSVTAIYELTLKNSPARLVDSLRYQSETTIADDPKSSEYGFLKIRYKLPDEDTSKLITEAIAPGTHEAGDRSPREARFAAAVAAFGQILRGSRYTGDFSPDDVIDLAQSAKGEDRFGYRAEFINLVRLAKSAAAMEQLRRR